MAYLVIYTKTSAQFTADNQVLLPNQIGQESDTDLTKVGDGVTAWNSLYYSTPVKNCFEQVLSALTYRVPSSYAVTQAIAAAPTPTLSAVLTAGNDTGGTTIEMGTAGGTGSALEYSDANGFAWTYYEPYSGGTQVSTLAYSNTYKFGARFVVQQYSGYSNAEMFVYNNNIGKYTYIALQPTASGAKIYSNISSFEGLKYAADYSASYTSRSLIDKGYAAATFAPISVTNSLTATYVGYGSGANVLTGSSGLVFDSVNNKLSVNGVDAMTVNGAAITTHLAAHGADGLTETEFEMHRHGNTAAAGAAIYGARSRGSVGAETIVQNGDALLNYTAVGYDGTDYATAAQIQFEVDGTPGANDMPGRIVFNTSPDGSQTLTERMRISANGNINITGLTASNIVLTDASKNLSSSATLPLSMGGLNANLTASNGGIFYSTATAGAILAGTATANQILMSGASTAPSWSTATYPSTITANYIPYATGTNVIGSSAEFTYTSSSGLLQVSKSQAALTYINVLNSSASLGAYAGMYVSNGTSDTGFLQNGTGSVGTGVLNIPNMGVMYAGGANGISLAAVHASGVLRFYSGGAAAANERARFLSSGELVIGGTTLIGTELLSIQRSVNSSTYVDIKNATSGTAAQAMYRATNAAGLISQIGVVSAGWTPYGAIAASNGYTYTSAAEFVICVDSASGVIKFAVGTSVPEKMRLSAAGNLSLGGTATRGTTVGTNAIQIFDGIAPVGTLTNGCSFYSTAGEMRVMDAAGNATLLSPHEKGTNYWIYDSVDTTTKKRLKIDMEQFMKWLNKKFKTDFVHEYITNN